jgi:hypothetical protein
MASTTIGGSLAASANATEEVSTSVSSSYDDGSVNVIFGLCGSDYAGIIHSILVSCPFLCLCFLDIF